MRVFTAVAEEAVRMQRGDAALEVLLILGAGCRRRIKSERAAAGTSPFLAILVALIVGKLVNRSECIVSTVSRDKVKQTSVLASREK